MLLARYRRVPSSPPEKSELRESTHPREGLDAPDLSTAGGRPTRFAPRRVGFRTRKLFKRALSALACIAVAQIAVWLLGSGERLSQIPATWSFLFPPVVAQGAAPTGGAATLGSDQLASLVGAVVLELEKREGSPFWSSVGKLEALGDAAVPALRTQLDTAGERGRLASAKALLSLLERSPHPDEELQAEATSTLKQLALSAEATEVRTASMDLLGTYGDPDNVQPFLEEIFAATVDPEVAIPLARTLWNLDRVDGARQRLLGYLDSASVEVKREAALTLAEIDYFEGEVRDILRTLKDEPSLRGRRATELERVLFLSRQLDRNLERGDTVLEGVDPQKLVQIKEARIRDLEEALEKAQESRDSAPGGPGADLLEEIILRIQKSYVDPDKVDRKRLLLSAVKGMVRSLDKFSSFMDPETTRSFQQNISGEYVGIGAQVNKRTRYLEIVKPIYGGPAHEAGLLSGDRVLKVDDVSTATAEIGALIDRLKGPADSEVVLNVVRRGWQEARDITIRRRKVEVPSVYSQFLPAGKVGYVQLQQFGDKTADEFVETLDQLDKEGMEGLILDLRDNPGGFLEAAVHVVDQFVSDDQELPIVTQKGRGRPGASEAEIPTFPTSFARTVPMVILLNENSASASEVVAGALQDFGRALVAGQRSFGKGSVQRLIPLSGKAHDFLEGEARLRLTVQYYFLPLGRCVHTIRDADGRVTERGGVTPGVKIEQEKIAVWRLEAIEKFRNDEAVLSYVHEHAEALKPLYLEGDNRDTSRYPDFDALYAQLETPAPQDDLRRVIRYHIRRRLEDANGREFACDFHEDRQLRLAIVELLGRMGQDADNFPQYSIAPDGEETGSDGEETGSDGEEAGSDAENDAKEGAAKSADDDAEKLERSTTTPRPADEGANE